MKTIQISIYKFVAGLYLLFTLLYSIDSFGQVGINNSIPNASSALDITSTSKGLLIPRMTSVQRLAIITPAVGLMVYETTTNQFFYFDGTTWRPLAANNSAWNTLGNSGTTAATNFIGTTDLNDLVVKTNNAEKMRITANGNVGIGTITPIQKLEVAGLNAAAATSGLGTNGIARLQPIGSSAAMDFGVFGGTTHGWIQVRDNGNYAANFNLSLNPNGGKVGIGTINPATALDVNGAITIQNNNNITWGGAFGAGIPTIASSLNDGIYFYPTGSTAGVVMKVSNSLVNVTGSIGMVDGNQAIGKVMTSDANGKGTWQDAKRTRYFSVSGTTIAQAPPTSLVQMPQMSVTFTANEPVVFARFNAAGANAGACGQRALSFQVLLNGVVVQATQTSIEDVTNIPSAKIWDINIEIPLNVVPGSVNTVSVFWGHLGTSCSPITNGPGSAVAPHGSYRVLTVVEP